MYSQYVGDSVFRILLELYLRIYLYRAVHLHFSNTNHLIDGMNSAMNPLLETV